MMALGMGAQAQPAQEKIQTSGEMTIDNATLDGFTIYRPADMLQAVAQYGPLPIVIFGNGACSHDSGYYAPMFANLVANGYVVIAVGEKANAPADQGGHDMATIGLGDNLLEALDWACAANATPDGEMYRMLDCYKVALSGHSCGGAQALSKSYDPRVSTTIMFNSGMGDIAMAGADTRSLANLHNPIIYIIGGPEDIAYGNAMLDFERVADVPVAIVNFPVGHGGTYGDSEGGVLGQVALQWLEWQLRGKADASRFFLNDQWRQSQYPDCDYKSRGL